MLSLGNYIIQKYFNIHRCRPGESVMSVVSVCTLRTAWQLVPYITASRPHTHMCARRNANPKRAHTHTQTHIITYKLQTYFTPPFSLWGTFQLNYLMLFLLQRRAYSLISFFLCVHNCVLYLDKWPPVIEHHCICVRSFIYLSFKPLGKQREGAVFLCLCSRYCFGDEMFDCLSSSPSQTPIKTVNTGIGLTPAPGLPSAYLCVHYPPCASSSQPLCDSPDLSRLTSTSRENLSLMTWDGEKRARLPMLKEEGNERRENGGEG